MAGKSVATQDQSFSSSESPPPPPAFPQLGGKEFDGLAAAELPPSPPLRGRLRLEQRQRLIRQQLTARDLE